MNITDKKLHTIGRLQYHIDCKPGDVGEYVLLPGDPARVERIARHLDDAQRVAYKREFQTYTGYYKGIKVSATSTGIGCPSTGIAVEELANIGAKTFIRVGSTGALQPEIHPGDLIIATGSMRNEGTSRFYAPLALPAVPDFYVTQALIESAKALSPQLNFVYHVGLVGSDDAFYAETPQFIAKLNRLGLKSVEMESSTIFIVCHLRGLRGAMIAAVSGNLFTGEGLFQGENPALVQGWENEIQVALEAIYRLSQG